MTPKQESAIKILESAFKACKSAGLCFCGIDDNLHVAPRSLLTSEVGKGGTSSTCETMLRLANYGPDEETRVVNTSRTYLDSGGA